MKPTRTRRRAPTTNRAIANIGCYRALRGLKELECLKDLGFDDLAHFFIGAVDRILGEGKITVQRRNRIGYLPNAGDHHGRNFLHKGVGALAAPDSTNDLLNHRSHRRQRELLHDIKLLHEL
jgi:hypothetical protein